MEQLQPNSLEKLRGVREALLRLHKNLLDDQRAVWERGNSRVKYSYEFLNPVMHDQQFAWLHYLSELVVQMDEMLALKEDYTDDDIVGLFEQARFLIVPAESGDSFQRNYFEALQQSPDVVLAHSEVVKLLGKRVPDVH